MSLLSNGTEIEDTFVKRWHAAVDGRDLEALTELLASNVVFESPAVYRPYKGKAMVGFILRLVAGNLPDLNYINGFSNGRGGVVLHFAASVTDDSGKKLSLDGVDIIELNAEGKVAKLTVMIRPLRCLSVLAAHMKASFEAQTKGA